MNDTEHNPDRLTDNPPDNELEIPHAQSASPASSQAGAAAAEAALASRPFSRSALYALAGEGKFDVVTLEGVLSLLGVRPDAPAWVRYCFHLLCTCGALFLASGVICFIAWNWHGLSHLSKFGLLQGLIAVSVLFALWRGLASTSGSAALTAAGLCLGPLLAVFGQTYMSGAYMWELYRAWACMLVPLALAGGSSGLWLLTWLVSSAWGLGYLENMSQSGFLSYGFPEFFLLQCVALCVLEICLYRVRPDSGPDSGPGSGRGSGRGSEQDANQSSGQSVLQNTWLPRLMVFALYAVTTFVLSLTILEQWQADRDYGRALFLPFMPSTALIYGLSLPALYFWYRYKRPDLFMLGCGLFSLCSLLVVKVGVELQLDLYGLFVLGLIVVILTALCGKLLFHLHRVMEAAGGAAPGKAAPDAKAPRQESAAGQENPTRPLRPAPRPFSFEHPPANWSGFQDLLRAHSLWPKDKPFPLPPPSGAPWYINTMLGFGGWVSALLFIGFITVLLLDKFHRSGSSMYDVFLIIGILLLIGGAVCSRLPGIFARQFGLASAISGTLLAAAALVLTDDKLFWPLPCLLLCVFGFSIVRNTTFRYIAAAASVFALYYLLDVLVWNVPGYRIYHFGSYLEDQAIITAIARSPLMALFWLALFALMAFGWHRHCRWLTRKGFAQVMEPLLFGVYTGLLLLSVLVTAFPSLFGIVPFLLIPRAGLGLAAASGCLLLVYLLGSRSVAKLPSDQPPGMHFGMYRLSLLACLLVFPLGWHLPGAAIALFGFLVSRHIGSVVLFGATSLYLAVSIALYYYNLDTTLLQKAYNLAAFGGLLLAAAGLLRFLCKQGKTRPLDAQTGLVSRQGLLPRMRLRAVALIGALGLSFCLFHFAALQKEALLEGGTSMYLRLAPVDPRAFLLGDYMSLRFSLEGEIANALRNSEQENATGRATTDGLAVVQLSDLGTASFVRLDDGTPLASGEHILYFRLKNRRPEVAAHAFFFQEGYAADFEKAAYGEIHVDEEGKNLLTHLLDNNLQRIKPKKLPVGP